MRAPFSFGGVWRLMNTSRFDKLREQFGRRSGSDDGSQTLKSLRSDFSQSFRARQMKKGPRYRGPFLWALKIQRLPPPPKALQRFERLLGTSATIDLQGSNFASPIPLPLPFLPVQFELEISSSSRGSRRERTTRSTLQTSSSQNDQADKRDDELERRRTYNR